MVYCKKRSKNLVIVTTPLQSCIVNKLMKEKDYDVVYLTTTNNKKNQYYYSVLAKAATNSMYYVLKCNNKFNSLLDYIVFNRKFELYSKYENVYLASINDRYVQLVLSKVEFINLYTFDDGFANINYNGLYYQKIIKKSFRDKIWFFLGNRYDIDQIKKKSLKHFTIYENEKNIIDNVEYLNIFENNFIDNVDSNSEIKFFLGQPLYELDGRFDNHYMENILSKVGIDFYFPHPRENYLLKEKEIINSELIFEDYLTQYMEKNPNKKIVLYSFFSTVFLNVNHKNVKKIAIYDNFLEIKYKNIYESMKNFGVSFKSVEELNE